MKYQKCEFVKDCAGTDMYDTRLLLLLNHNFDADGDDELLYRTKKESVGSDAEDFSVTQSFRKIPYVSLLPMGKRAVQIPLKYGFRTTFVELLDVKSGISACLLMRLNGYECPYEVDKIVETLVKVTGPRSELSDMEDFSGKKKDFLSTLFNMTDMTFKNPSEEEQMRMSVEVVSSDVPRQTRMSVEVLSSDVPRTVEPIADPILKNQIEYDKQRICFFENDESPLITGLYWCNYDHWRRCNEHLFRSPTMECWEPATSSSSIPEDVRTMRSFFLNSLRSNFLTDCSIPEEITKLGYNPSSVYADLVKSREHLQIIYEGVKEYVFMSLLFLDLCENEGTHTIHQIDYGNNFLVSSERGVYSTSRQKEDPFSPWMNKFTRERWGMGQYCQLAQYLTSDRPSYSGDVITFFVRGGKVTDVVYGKRDNRWNWGHANLDRDDIWISHFNDKLAAVVSITDMDVHLEKKTTEMLIQLYRMIWVDNRIAAVCHANTVTGKLVITHPLFPKNTCISFYPEAMGMVETELVITSIVEATHILDGTTLEILTSC